MRHLRCVVLAANSSAASAETLPAETRLAVKRQRQDTSTTDSWLGKMLVGLKDTLSVLRRSELFAKLAIVMMVSGIVFECIQDLLFNYLIITMGFGASDNAGILIAIGLCGLAVQVLLRFGICQLKFELRCQH